jgi:hypothetical protein
MGLNLKSIEHGIIDISIGKFSLADRIDCSLQQICQARNFLLIRFRSRFALPFTLHVLYLIQHNNSLTVVLEY